MFVFFLPFLEVLYNLFREYPSGKYNGVGGLAGLFLKHFFRFGGLPFKKTRTGISNSTIYNDENTYEI